MTFSILKVILFCSSVVSDIIHYDGRAFCYKLKQYFRGMYDGICDLFGVRVWALPFPIRIKHCIALWHDDDTHSGVVGRDGAHSGQSLSLSMRRVLS
jgi:hypothetical protein